MIILNNLIYYSEIAGFKNILLDPDQNWYLKNNITGDKITITMLQSKYIDCNATHIACFERNKKPAKLFYFQEYIKPQVRLNLVKNEIKKNLPNVEINSNDLYIHIRSGDVFNPYFSGNYAQPPFCFYQNIINNFKFRNIYIIAQNKNNPIIDKIINEYPKVIYKRNTILLDIAYLSNAYNLVASVS